MKTLTTNHRNALFLLLFIGIQLGFSSSSFAVDIQSYRFTNSLEFQGLESAWTDNPQTQKEYPWILTTALSYFQRPLVWEDDPREHQYDAIVNSSRVLHFGAGFRLGPGLLSFNSAFVQQFHLKDLSDNYQGNRYSFQDTNLRYHWTLWTLASDNNEQNKTFGLAIIPQITLPTGKEDFYLSDKSFPGYGLEISAEKRLNSFHLVGNVGIHFSPKAVLMNMDRRRMILTALGAYVPLSHDRSWATTLEWRRNWTRVSDYNPTEIHLSLQKTWNTSLTGFASLGTSDPRHILHGVNGNNFRVLAGLKYQPSTTLAKNAPSIADSTTTPLAETALLPTTPSTASSSNCCIAKRDFTIYFDVDHSYIRTKESKILDQAIASYRQLEHASVLIISHTDERASVTYNQKLSEKRSEEVARYFLSQGIPASAIEKISLGKHQLKLIHAQHESDHEKNRRSEIHIIHHLENDSSSLTQECQP